MSEAYCLSAEQTLLLVLCKVLMHWLRSLQPDWKARETALFKGKPSRPMSGEEEGLKQQQEGGSNRYRTQTNKICVKPHKKWNSVSFCPIGPSGECPAGMVYEDAAIIAHCEKCPLGEALDPRTSLQSNGSA